MHRLIRLRGSYKLTTILENFCWLITTNITTNLTQTTPLLEHFADKYFYLTEDQLNCFRFHMAIEVKQVMTSISSLLPEMKQAMNNRSNQSQA